MHLLIRHRDAGSRRLVSRLEPLLPGWTFSGVMPDEPLPSMEGVDAVLAIGTVDRAMIERGSFRLIQTVGTGYDNVDVQAAAERGIWVANVPARETGNAESVAEHALLLLLALARKLPAAQAALREGRWAQPVGTALFRKHALVIGLGDVGAALATRLTALGLTVTATRTHPERGGPAGVTVLPAADLHHALPNTDFVLLCARAGDANRNLIDARALALCRPGVLLVNVARGSLLDHDALHAALLSGQAGGAGLDVFWDEPVNPAHPLLALPQVIATPHVGGVTDLNLRNTLELISQNFQRFAAGETPRFLVNSLRGQVH